MKRTVKDIKEMLDTLPDDLPVEFMPVTDAWLGVPHPLHVSEIHFWDREGEEAVLPSDEGAHAEIYLREARLETTTS